MDVRLALASFRLDLAQRECVYSSLLIPAQTREEAQVRAAAFVGEIENKLQVCAEASVRYFPHAATASLALCVRPLK